MNALASCARETEAGLSMKTKRWRPSPQHAMWSAAVFALGAWSGARWAERGARASAWARPDAGLAVRADTTRCSPEVERDSAPTPRARAAAPDLPHTGRDLDALLSELGQPGGADAAWNELVARMRVDGRAREQVLQQFLDADDDEAETLSQLLCAGAPAETSRFALELAHRGGMSAARKALSLPQIRARGARHRQRPCARERCRACAPSARCAPP